MKGTTPQRGLSVTTADLQAIASAHGLGHVRQHEWLGRGRNNPALVVNGDWVVRFDGLPGNLPQRFEGEALAYRLLREQHVPAPEVLGVDLSQQVFPSAYIILSRLPGLPVVDAWQTMSAAQQEQIAAEAGRVLAQMHGIHAAQCGDLRRPQVTFPAWHSYLDDYLQTYLRESLGSGLIDAPLAGRLERVLADLRPLFDQVVQPSLVHRDFHFENVLCHHGAITGVIDFEWSLWGDPLCDFRTEGELERVCPGSSAAVYAAYGELRPMPADFQRRHACYQMLMALEFLEDALDDAEAQESSDLLMACLSRLES
jgi:aminoglycoside phosphotransferase (APT) family kinase protein